MLTKFLKIEAKTQESVVNSLVGHFRTTEDAECLQLTS